MYSQSIASISFRPSPFVRECHELIVTEVLIRASRLAESMSVPPRSSSLNPSVPQTVQTLEFNHSPSVISSRVTDIVSEDGDEYHPEGAIAAAAQSKAKVLTESQYDHHRPASSQRDNWNRLPPLARSVLPIANWGGWRPGNAFGGPGVTMTNTSRPQSATSRSSRTHAPSITSHAFFRPMSSQRLQAQRGRPLTSGQTNVNSATQSNIGSSINRQSLGSNHTGQSGRAGYQENDVPPPSRDTEFTEQDLRDRASVNAGHITAQSIDESTRPLHRHPSYQRSDYPELHSNYTQDFSGNTPEQISSRSFQSSLLPAKSHSSLTQAMSNHNRYSSDATPPKLEHEGSPMMIETESGRNHEFFPGNTVFCCGGRFQNTRQRPINIATGALVILPAVLFFVYS